MDNGKGDFVRVPQTVDIKTLSSKLQDRIFQVGEIVAVKDSRFRIMSIGNKEMRLRLLPDDYLER